MPQKTILFICKGNSGRSQMAEAFFNSSSAVSKGWSAISGGTEPDPDVHPWTIKLMEELDIDMSNARPKPATQDIMKSADRIILMDSDLLTFIPRDVYGKIEIWNVEKLYGKTKEEVLKTRNLIRSKIELLAAGL